MKGQESLRLLIGAVLVVTALWTLFLNGGWVIWVPTLVALYVVSRIIKNFNG